ncbi:MAG: DsrE family protein [Candidatus Eremiobacteraeota bacterium]|nr:DsrE family protein [Candidatus Eremiobacteraeota bacterium]
MKPTVPPSFAEKDLNYYLRMIRGDFAELEEGQPAKAMSSSKQKNIVLLLGSTALGSGNQELGERLLKFFIKALIHNRVKPRAVILVNEAVHLATDESAVLDDLVVLTEQGVRVMVCVLSADEYGIEDGIKVGCIADMDNICDFLLTAWKVIAL